jgi:DNA-binding transcriptional LysR family regulator
MRTVTMRTGALGRLELITQISGYDSIAAAARALYGGRDGALQQMIRKIETGAGFRIIDRSSTPLAPTDGGREFIREALQILQAAREQTPHPRWGFEDAEVPCGHAENPSAAGLTPPAI